MKKIFAMAAAFAMMSIIMGSMPVSAADLTVIVASNATDPTNPYNYGLDKFKEVAEKVSGGAIEVVLQKGYLGQDESELIEKLTSGSVDIVVCSPGFMMALGVPEIEIFSLEYLFNSFEHWESCLDGDFGAEMRSIVRERTDNQFHILGYWSSSVRDVYANKPVTKPGDLAGMTLRTQDSKVQQEFFQACGASTTVIPWGDVYDALKAGEVDGAENDYTNLTLKNHHLTENGKYISETHHDFTTRLFLTEGHRFDTFTDEQKEWIQQAADAATTEERKVTYRMYDESKKKAIDDGAVITEFDDIDIDAFKEIAVPIQDSFAEKNDMTAFLELIRAEEQK